MGILARYALRNNGYKVVFYCNVKLRFDCNKNIP